MKALAPILALLLCLIPLAVTGAPPKPRPFAGIGLLVVRPLTPERRADIATVPLYRTPGVGRLRDAVPAELPGLQPIFRDSTGGGATEGEVRLAVAGQKGGWLRIVYDEAGHEGWLAPARSFGYTAWEEFLPGRDVRLLPGLRKEYLLLRNAPAADAGELGSVGRQSRLRVVRVRDDWALVAFAGGSGWLRWRDEDGRFLVSVGEASAPQNR